RSGTQPDAAAYLVLGIRAHVLLLPRRRPHLGGPAGSRWQTPDHCLRDPAERRRERARTDDDLGNSAGDRLGGGHCGGEPVVAAARLPGRRAAGARRVVEPLPEPGGSAAECVLTRAVVLAMPNPGSQTR